MKSGINYWSFPKESNGDSPDLVEAMWEARNLGYECFEFTVEQEGLVSLRMTAEEAENLKAQAAEIGLEIPTLASAIGWQVSPTDPNPKVRDQAVKNYEKVLHIASWLGVDTVLYIPGMVSSPFAPDFEPQSYDVVDSRAKKSLEKLIPTAEKLKIRIGVENVWNRYLLSPLEMRDFIDFFDSPWVGCYFDVGNVMLYGHPEHWISILGKRIFAVHLKDFKTDVGNASGFVDLLQGDVNYPAVMKALKENGYQGPLTVEVPPKHPYILERSIRAIEKIQEMD